MLEGWISRALQRFEATGTIRRGEWVARTPDGRVRAAHESDSDLEGRAMCASEAGYNVIVLSTEAIRELGYPEP